MGNISIQKLDHKDYKTSEEIWKVFQLSYQVEADLVGLTDFPPLKRTANDLKESATNFYGALINDKIAAVIEIELTDKLLDISSLVVDPDFFRQGIGSKLMDFVINKYNPQKSVVETAAVNDPAIALYKRKGYVLVEQWMTSFQIEKVKLIREIKS